MDGTGTAKLTCMEDHAFSLSRDDLRQIARHDVMERGETLYFRGAVEGLRQEGGVLQARVHGSTGLYHVELASGAGSWRCSCAKGRDRRVERSGDPTVDDACKHVVALGFAWLLGSGRLPAGPAGARPARPE